MQYEEFLRHFEVKIRKPDSAQAICPAHNDKKESLTITREGNKILLHCHAGCDTEAILGSVGLTFQDIGDYSPPKWKERLEYGMKKKIEDVYDYVAEDGVYLYSKVRFEGKEIRYVTIDKENDRYDFCKQNKKTLYKLPQLIKAIKKGHTVYIVEGEKDVKSLNEIGFVATTAGAVGDWRSEYATYFTGADVVILPDNDVVGLKLKDSILKDLKCYAHSVRWTLTSRTEKGDVTDFIRKENHTRNDLLESVRKAEIHYAPWICESGSSKNQSLRVNAGILADNINEGMDYLIVRQPYDDKDDFYLYEHGVYQKCNINKAKGVIRRYIPAVLQSDTLLKNTYNLLLTREDHICTFRDLDVDDHYINFKNGLLNIQTMKLESHNPRVYSTLQYNFEYDPSKKNRPVFDKFMDDLCRNEDGAVDKEIKALLQEFGGIILSNENVAERLKKCLVLHSLLGNTGKSQFLNLLCELIGTDNIANIPIQNMNEASKFALGGIVGKRLICVGDQTGSEIKDSSIFKQLTGNDGVKCEKKGKQPFTYKFRGGIVIACNNLPSFADDKGGHLFERLCVIPCTHTIPLDRRDNQLLEKLLTEKVAIFNWFLEGLIRLRNNQYRLTASKSCSAVMSEYRNRLDTVYRYVTEHYIITGNREDRISKSEFDSNYTRWCDENGYNHVNKQNIQSRMASIGCPADKGNLVNSNKERRGVFIYRCLRWKEQDFEAVEAGDKTPFDIDSESTSGSYREFESDNLDLFVEGGDLR